ncbi:helix-turn-helix transcriptional regulator [Candidatus Erwinia dacicola]|nr:helix-turn-helix transcriptional regulator [Candidatus Erwinia dacicola]
MQRTKLTARGKTLIELLRVNATPHQIASCMALRPKTVSTYKRSVMHKLGMQKNLDLYQLVIVVELHR